MTEKPISVSDKKIDVKDLPLIAEQIVLEYDRRKDNRKDREKDWKEIDRQLAMLPERSHKMGADNKVDANKAWLPEIELPLQSQTLEMLTADCRRLLFPRGKEFFLARAALTDEFVTKFKAAETPISREKGPFEGEVSQDDGDRVAQAVLAHYHSQYDLRGNVDMINGEALTYGFGVGRLRKVRKRVLGHTMKGSPKNLIIPMLIPRSAKHVYLDDSTHAVMNEGQEIGPNTIEWYSKKFADVKAAAQSDSTYIKSQLDRITPDDKGNITLIELEGDLVYETSQETIVVRDVNLTAAVGDRSKNTTFGLIRNQSGEGSTYLVFDYHKENSSDNIGTSPLIKGRPINRIMALIMNELIASGQLKTLPPISYSKDDPGFAGTGGPVIHPGVQWEGTDEIQVHADVGGDPNTFFAVFQGLTQLYDDVTGVNSPRLGAATKSHTTAFAKDAELSQGAVRTVDYVDSILDGPITRFLEMEYQIALKSWKKQIVYIDAWNEFAEFERAHLPDIVKFKALGDRAPSDDQVATQRKLSSIQLALQIDAAAIQLGGEPKLDHGKIIEQVLRDGGIQDISEITTEEGPSEPAEGQLPGVLTGNFQ